MDDARDVKGRGTVIIVIFVFLPTVLVFLDKLNPSD